MCLVPSFACGENWHDPVQCKWLRKWIKKCDDDSETSNWIAANTRVSGHVNVLRFISYYFYCTLYCEVLLDFPFLIFHSVCLHYCLQLGESFVINICSGDWQPFGSIVPMLEFRFIQSANNLCVAASVCHS